MVEVIKIKRYAIPMGTRNKFDSPHGELIVTDGKVTKCVRFGYMRDEFGAQLPPCEQYVTFQRKRYKYHNVGTLWNPKFALEEVAE